MKNKHAILAAALALLILAGNALALPKLLSHAQALPEGEVVTQPSADTGQRVPLPALPEGIGGYQLRFSRELTAQEQALWDGLEREIKADDTLCSGVPSAKVVYTPRAMQRLKTSLLHNVADPVKREAELDQQYFVGDGAPGQILIDLGSVTLCVGEQQLTREQALPLMSMEIVADQHGARYDYYYGLMYHDFMWLKPDDTAQYKRTRGLYDEEQTRFSSLQTRYLLDGLRPTAPLPSAETPDGTLWFDEQTKTIHLPAQFQMTDDETLHYIELIDSLTRRSLLESLPGMITQQQAEALARDWAAKLLGMDADAQSAFTSLFDHGTGGRASEPIWRVQLGPADMLIRMDRGDYAFDGCEILLNAADGALSTASRTRSRTPRPPQDKTPKQVKKEIKAKAAELVKASFEGGRQPTKVVVNGEQYDGSMDGYPTDADMPNMVSCVVSMAGGVDYELGFATGDAALVSYRYWPDGCKDMG